MGFVWRKRQFQCRERDLWHVQKHASLPKPLWVKLPQETGIMFLRPLASSSSSITSSSRGWRGPSERTRAQSPSSRTPDGSASRSVLLLRFFNGMELPASCWIRSSWLKSRLIINTPEIFERGAIRTAIRRLIPPVPTLGFVSLDRTLALIR